MTSTEPLDDPGLFASLHIVERGLLPAPVARLLGWGRARAMRVLPVDLGGVGSAFSELFEGPAVQALARLGIRAVDRPHEADVIMVTGAISPRGVDALRTCLAQVARPRYVVAVGDEVQGRGAAGATLVPLDELLPIDVRLDGPDLRADAILAALLQLAEQVRIEDPAARWTVAAAPIEPGGALGVTSAGRLGSRPPLAAELAVAAADATVAHVALCTGGTHRGLEAALAGTAEPWRAPLARHLDRASAVALPLALTQAVEHALGIEPTDDERWRRAVLLEASRVAAALDDLGPVSALLGAPRRVATAGVAAVRLHRAGQTGVAKVAAALPAAHAWLAAFVREVLGSARVQRQTRDRAIVPVEVALAGGLSGVNLRASGAAFDLRAPGGDPLDPWATGGWRPRSHPSGDVYARLWLRAIEALDAIALLEELLARPPRASALQPVADLTRTTVAGEGESLVEHPHGALWCQVVTTGDPQAPLWRVRVAGPSRTARAMLPGVLRGAALEDVPRIVASFAVSVVEADR